MLTIHEVYILSKRYALSPFLQTLEKPHNVKIKKVSASIAVNQFRITVNHPMLVGRPFCFYRSTIFKWFEKNLSLVAAVNHP